MQPKFRFLRWKNAAGIFLIIFSITISACSSLQASIPIQELFNTLESRGLSGSVTQTPTHTPVTIAPELPLSLPEDNPLPGSSPRPTATPTAFPLNNATITPSPAPTSSSDLLFLSQSKLMRWDHVTQFATLLVDRVADFTALVDPFSAYQQPIHADMAVKKFPRLIALLRSHEVTANGIELYDLEILDLETKLMTTLLEEIPRIYAMQFTLQGDRLVYIDREIDDQIIVTKTASGSEPLVIATCHRDGELTCQDAWWSPDGRSLVWSDAEGIWLADDRTSGSRKIQSNLIKILDPKKQESEINVSFEIISWSPDNRFILVKIIPSAQGVQWFSLLDTRQPRLIDIPGTADFSTPAEKIAWTFTGNLMLAQAGNPESKQDPVLKFWQIVPTNNSVLVAGDHLNLAHDPSTGLRESYTQQIVCPIWLQHVAPNTIRLGLVNPDGQSQAFLAELNLEKNILTQRMAIPGDTEKILWAPDGSGALILGKHGQIVFASLNNQELFDLLSVIEQDAHSFLWLAPASR